MKKDRSGRTLEDYRELFWEAEKTIKELEAEVTEIPTICRRYEKRIRELEAELLKARKLSDHWMVKHDELQAKLDAVKHEAIGCTYAAMCTYAMNGKDITKVEFPEIAEGVLKALGLDLQEQSDE